PDRKTLAACTVAGVTAWSTSTFEALSTAGVRSSLAPRALAFAPNGRLAVATEEHVLLSLLHIDSGAKVLPLPKRSSIERMAISPDGSELGVSVAGGVTHLFDLPSGAAGSPVAGRELASRRPGGVATATGQRIEMRHRDAPESHQTLTGHTDDV